MSSEKYVVPKREAIVVKDPYSDQNPFKINGKIPPNDEFPEGQVLRWCNEEVRKTRGWRGWIPLEWGDEYTGEKGELLLGYGITDIPAQLSGPDRIDNSVRRGDVMLCRLRSEWWDQRRQARKDEDARLRSKATGPDTMTIKSPGVRSVGTGMVDDNNKR